MGLLWDASEVLMRWFLDALNTLIKGFQKVPGPAGQPVWWRARQQPHMSLPKQGLGIVSTSRLHKRHGISSYEILMGHLRPTYGAIIGHLWSPYSMLLMHLLITSSSPWTSMAASSAERKTATPCLCLSKE